MLKTAILLLALLALFGIAGRMDFEIAAESSAARMSCEIPAVPALVRGGIPRIKVVSPCVVAPRQITRRA
ncbi:MAG: hypothetical protein E6R14_08990 [Thermomicrobiales bacterium]|nr:MAG: hypothetical protein E6R14_08990 [Thermomicrobiales bacterium]